MVGFSESHGAAALPSLSAALSPLQAEPLRQLSPRKLSQDIGALLEGLAESPPRLRNVLDMTHGRAYTLLLILLALPFCTPIPLPGFSTLFGMLIVLIGARLALLQKPWLPERALNKELPRKLVVRLLGVSRKVVEGLEFFLRPRLCFLIDFKRLHHLYGLMIFVSGVLLLLPLPVPFTNLLPAATVVLLSAAMLERDGYFVIAGAAVFLVTLAFFAALCFGGAELMERLQGWFVVVLAYIRNFGESASVSE